MLDSHIRFYYGGSAWYDPLSFACSTNGVQKGGESEALFVPDMKKDSKRLGIQLIQLEVEGFRRKYLLYVPESYRENSPVPLLIVLHGAGGTAVVAAKDTGWNQKSEDEGFLVAYPEATRPDQSQQPSFLKNPQVWIDGSNRGYADRSGIDDISFIRQVIASIQSKYVIDNDRIFITEFSNGASMTYRTGVELADIVAAVAPVSGHLWVRTARLEPPVSLLAISGKSDPLNPFNGGTVTIPWGQTVVQPAIQDSVSTWSQMLGCEAPPALILEVDGVEVHSFCKRADGTEALLYAIEGHGHVWPGGHNSLSERIVGKATDKLVAVNSIWEFFVKHSRLPNNCEKRKLSDEVSL